MDTSGKLPESVLAQIKDRRFIDKKILVPGGKSVPGPVIRFLRTRRYDLGMGGQVPCKRGAATLHAAYQHELRPRSAICQPEAWVIEGQSLVLVCIHVWATNLENENYLAPFES